jgi:arsenate reductase (glutaredoxin)
VAVDRIKGVGHGSTLIPPLANAREAREDAAMILYGIRHCDTVKKARAWLDVAVVEYTFHDYQASGVPEAALRDWVARLGWEALLNRAGTTFRRLPEGDKADVDGERAILLMLAHPSLIRRPVLVAGEALLVGFKPDAYEAVLR